MTYVKMLFVSFVLCLCAVWIPLGAYNFIVFDYPSWFQFRISVVVAGFFALIFLLSKEY